MPKRKPTPRPTDLRRAILDASLALLEDGVAALSMREVARRAHVTHAAPYHHFPDRGAIMAALAQEGFDLMAAQMDAAMRLEPVGSIARFEAIGRAYVTFAVEHAPYMRVMFRPELFPAAVHPKVDECALCAMQILVDCVAECQKGGTIPAGDASGIVLTSWAAMHGLAMLWIDGPLSRLYPASSPLVMAEAVTSALGGLLVAASRRMDRGAPPDPVPSTHGPRASPRRR
jgi:AcrR family transcriptional regulator